jgi:pimeloyl-ACP methyl ester carboxylesterase
VSSPRRRRRAGTQDPVRVLLLHGLGGRPSVWDEFAGRAPERCELWDVALPWEGTPAGGEWSHAGDPVDLLVSTVKGHTGDDPTAYDRFDVIVAHSFAANLLAEALSRGLLAARPVVLVSPFYRPSPRDFDWPTITYYLNDFHLTFAEALRVGETGRFPEAHRTWMAMRLRDQTGPYGWMRFFETYLRSPFLDLTAIRTPVLVVGGHTDIAARPSDGRAMADALPCARFELLEQAGHFPMVEQPDRFAAAIRDFLSDLPTAAPADLPESVWS